MRLNYNLLKPLSFLLETQSINDTATQLKTSSSAVSRTLKTLRHIFEDELLTRKNGKMELTTKAIALREKVSRIIEEIESLTENESFNPLMLTSNITIAMNASIAQWFAPLLIDHLAKNAPGIKLTIEDWSDATPQHICEHRVDYGIHYFPLNLSKNLVQKCGELDHFVVVCRTQHPLATQNIKLDHFRQFPLAVHVMKYWNEGQDHLSRYLKKLGVETNVALRTTHLSVLLKALENNDYLFPCSINLAKTLDTKFTYISSDSLSFAPLQQRNFGFLYDKTRSNDELIHWFHGEISELMRNQVRNH
uniref:Transcriptional regulator, LysR family n=1 Tax=Shewanella sp. (strain MR-7) TaxID=60481 RepID=Q0HVG3_SHESR